LEYYSWIDCVCDVQSLIHVINLHGKDLIGAEVGVAKAHSFCTLLQNCPNIKTLYGIDSYKPYVDYLKPISDGKPAYQIDEKEIEYIKLLAYHNIKYSGFANKAILYEMDSNLACDKFQDASLDFIFIDTYMDYDQALNDLNVWIPKVKEGGIVAGHDWNCNDIKKAVSVYRNSNYVERTMSTFDSLWCWIK